MVRLTAKPSLRDASCCNFEVMKGGTGFRLRSLVVTSLTTKVCFSASATISSALDSSLIQNFVLLEVLIKTARLDGLLSDFEEPRIERRRQF